MQIKIKCVSDKDKLMLPIHYNHIMQGVVYSLFPNDLANFLHKEGYKVGKRQFKLFTFSSVLNKGRKISGFELSEEKKRLGMDPDFMFSDIGKDAMHDSALLFDGGIEFYISSPKDSLLFGLVNYALSHPDIIVLNQKLIIAFIEARKIPDISNKVIIKTLSPITIHSTINIKDRKVVYFYRPSEKAFSELISNNLQKKYYLIYGKKIKGNVSIKPLYFNEYKNKVITYFKHQRIVAWKGIYEISGNSELIKIAYETGLGSRNSAGFGMIGLLGRDKNLTPKLRDLRQQ